VLARGPVQALKKGGIENGSSLRSYQQGLSLLERSQRHLTHDFRHPQASSSASCGLFDLLPSSSDTAWIGVPAICTEHARAGRRRPPWLTDDRQTPTVRQADTSHKRANTIISKPIQAIILCPFTRISSAWTGTKSSCPGWTNLWWICWQCVPSRSRQLTTVCSINPNACTGQP
jgi:hypothetical protein